MKQGNLQNLLTVDFEDWSSSSLSLLQKAEAEKAGKYLPEKDKQIERGINRLLEMLDSAKASATFFVLGRIAKPYRALLETICKQGHEIGSHTMTHTPLFDLNVKGLEYELRASKEMLEDMLGTAVTGFRAPLLCPYPDDAVFRDTLLTAGYTYDSSFRSDCYKKISFNGLKEFPVTVFRLSILPVPFGGTWLKLMGKSKVLQLVKKENLQNRPAVLYMHPYEIDNSPVCWPHPDPSIRARLSLIMRNMGKAKNEEIVSSLIKNQPFTSIANYMANERMPNRKTTLPSSRESLHPFATGR